MTKKPIEDRVSTHTTYRVVKVNDRDFNTIPRKAHRSMTAALRVISDLARDLPGGVGGGEHWRIVEIPSGEPWDYDGIIVATIRTGRGVE